MQRLTKYSLLLSAIRRHITDENDGEIMDAMVSQIFVLNLTGRVDLAAELNNILV